MTKRFFKKKSYGITSEYFGSIVDVYCISTWYPPWYHAKDTEDYAMT